MSHFKAFVWWPLLVLVFAAAQVFAEPATVLLEDFDGEEKLSERWTALGEITVSRIDVPPGVQHDGVGGKMVRAVAEASAKLAVRPTFPRPAYEQAEAIRLRVRPEGVSDDDPLVLEFQVFSAQRRAWFWRKVILQQEAWQTIDLPLCYFRHSPGALLDWSEAHRLAIHFRNAGTLSVDGIELIPGEGDHPAYLSAEDLGRLAFDDDAQYHRGDPFVVVTDDERLDEDAVLAALEELETMLRRDFPDLPPARRPVVLLVFADGDEYRAFWPELGRQFNAVVPAITSGGYTLLGVAGSSYSDEYGPVRPVYVHEACHALLAQLLGVSNQGEWLHEGLANYYQLHWSTQDVHALMRAAIDQGRHVPLKELLSGRRIATRDYAQAVLFVKWLLEDPARRNKLQSAMLEMKGRASTELAPLAQKHLGMTLDEMEQTWLAWAKSPEAFR